MPDRVIRIASTIAPHARTVDVSQSSSYSEPGALQVVEPTARQQGARRRADRVAAFPAAPVRVLLLRFDPMRVAGLQAAFEQNAGIEILVEDPSLELERELESPWLDPNIDIAVIGSQLGEGTLKLIASVRSACPNLPVVIMSPAAGDEAVLRVLSLGAKGFLHETTTVAQFEEAIRAILEGTLWAPRRLLATLIERLLASRDLQPSMANVVFTEREQQVLDLLLDGQSNREIAQSMNIEERTVKSYIAKLMGKVGVKNRTALSMQAISGKQG